MSAQDNTIDLYQTIMQINASSQMLKIARQIGLFDHLAEGQQTIDELCESLAKDLPPSAGEQSASDGKQSVERESLALLLDTLVAIGIIEKYDQDFALSHAARLLCQYDSDFGDAVWEPIPDLVTGKTKRGDVDEHLRRNRNAATQWVHTPAAMQAAEILNVGGEGEPEGISILDLACGSSVWSCAMAHRDPHSSVKAIDHERMLPAAQATADSLGLGERFQTLAGDSLEIELEASSVDLVLIAGRLHELDDDLAAKLLDRATLAAKPGGRVVVIDLFRGPARPTLTEAIEALRLNAGTHGGRMRTLPESQQMMKNAGLGNIQFTFLAASRANLGMAVGTKDSAS